MKKILTLAKTTYIGVVKTPIYYILILLFAAGIYFTQFFTMFGFGNEVSMYKEVSSSTILLGGTLLAIVLSVLFITDEAKNKITYTIISKPVKRKYYIIAKFLGLYFAIISGMLLCLLAFIIGLWQMDGLPKVEALVHQTYTGISQQNPIIAFIITYFTTEGPVIISVFISALFHIGIMLGFAVIFATHFSVIINVSLCGFIFLIGHKTNYIYDIAKTHTGWFTKSIATVFYYLLPNLENTNLSWVFLPKEVISFNYLFLLFMYSLVYITILLTIGARSFKYKEL